jgi:hypothetical protein
VKALDTNVLVRYYVQDEPRQAATAARIMSEEAAVRHYRRGIDFADAPHLAASHACSELPIFDDRGYARRAAKLGLKPPVRILAT